MRAPLLALFAILLWLLAGALALADAPAPGGTALVVDPSAEADLGTATRTLVVGSDVALGETVVTGPSGDVQLLFSDQTRLVIGPKSSLKLETYLLRPDNTASEVAVNALSGTFRFFTGRSAKSAYRIDTPSGMIGVRGTAFDFTVDRFGTTLVLFHGAVQMCTTAGKCIDVTATCGVGRLGGSSAIVLGAAQQAGENLRARFTYVQSDQGLRPDFRAAGAGACLPAVRATTGGTAIAAPAHIVAPAKAGVHPARPTRAAPPRRRPPVVSNPCADYRDMTPAQKLALRREHIYCAGSPPPPRNAEPAPGGLIGDPLQFPPPPRRGNDDGGVIE